LTEPCQRAETGDLAGDLASQGGDRTRTGDSWIRNATWRGLATRYDKTATVYLAALHIVGIFIWSRR